jgi:hypothetical protein
VIAEEGQAALAMELGEAAEKQAPEQTREHTHGEEEVRPAGDRFSSDDAHWHAMQNPAGPDGIIHRGLQFSTGGHKGRAVPVYFTMISGPMK